MMKRISELEQLQNEQRIQSFELKVTYDQLECRVLVSIPSSYLATVSRDAVADNQGAFLVITMAFNRPSGAPNVKKASVVYSEELESLIDKQAAGKWKRLNFTDIRSFVDLVEEEVILKIRQVEQDWKDRAAFLLDIYAALENMVGIVMYMPCNRNGALVTQKYCIFGGRLKFFDCIGGIHIS
jgi:hypothetical protein